MKVAIFSDVHSNLPALEAVLRDIQKSGAQVKVCLGDIVGYNADPVQCLELVRDTCDLVIQGNHDYACSSDMEVSWFNPVARAGIEFSREQLSDEQKSFLLHLPLVKTRDWWTYVHASLKNPAEWDYIACDESAREHFAKQETPLAFCAHTHRACVWHYTPSGRLTSHQTPQHSDVSGPGKHLANAGATGQPRDGDPRASYLLFDSEKKEITFRRVEYEVRAAQRAIRAAGLPRFLAYRLELAI